MTWGNEDRPGVRFVLGPGLELHGPGLGCLNDLQGRVYGPIVHLCLGRVGPGLGLALSCAGRVRPGLGRVDLIFNNPSGPGLSLPFRGETRHGDRKVRVLRETAGQSHFAILATRP